MQTEPEQITEAEVEAVPDWIFSLASAIVLGQQGCGNAAVLIQRVFEERERELREALKPFAARQTVAEALADPTPPAWAGLSIEDRIKVMGENKAKHDAEILAARQALKETPDAQ